MGDFFRIQDLGLIFFIIAAAYFAFRYFALEHALQETARELSQIQGDLLRNQILHLPLPDKGLERLMESINGALEQIRRERMAYKKREQEFQQQIENISHDLRTPLTVILGYLKWLKAPSGNASFRLEESLDVLERGARSMEHLVSQFYAFSRVNGMDFSLELEQLEEKAKAMTQKLGESCGQLRFPGERGVLSGKPPAGASCDGTGEQGCLSAHLREHAHKRRKICPQLSGHPHAGKLWAGSDSF